MQSLQSSAGDLKALQTVRKDMVSNLLEMFHKVNAGHIGSCLSCVEILIYIFFTQIRGDADRFILSKGHAACALYNVLAKSGKLDPELLKTFYQDATLLAAHPPCQGSKYEIKAIPFGTGSLGHGLSLAVGMAMADVLKKKNEARMYCLLSDGECNEGSVWEAALFAAHHKLKNLWVVVDANGLQGFGETNQVLKMNLEEKWRSFGFEVLVADNGNDFASLENSFQKLISLSSDKPKCVIAKTTKGSGVSFMENKLEWHYLPMKDLQFDQAVKETQSRQTKV